MQVVAEDVRYSSGYSFLRSVPKQACMHPSHPLVSEGNSALENIWCQHNMQHIGRSCKRRLCGFMHSESSAAGLLQVWTV